MPGVREVHNVRVMHLRDGYELSLHVKLPRELPLGEAHDAVERLEAPVLAAVPELRQSTRTSSRSRGPTGRAGPPRDDVGDRARGDRRTSSAQLHGRARRRRCRFRDGERRPHSARHVTLPADQPLPRAHRHAGDDRGGGARALPELADVIVHTEPAEAPAKAD